MSISEDKNVPELRFKGYTENWEQRKLYDYKDVRDGTHDSPKYYQFGHPLVTSKNLKPFGLDMTDISLISTKDFDAINKRSKVDKGDILFGMIGTIGNPVIIDRSDFAIKNVALIKEGGDITNLFLIQLLKSPVFDKYIRNENVGNTQKFIGLNKIRDFKFLAPNLEEQNKIAMFLKRLDNTIALHQEKLSKLNALKEAYLQQMFPQYKENNPKVRFTNFGEKWQKSKLSEVLNVNSGRDYKHLKSGDVPVYGTGGYMLSVDQCLSDEDAIGIGRKGTIDKPQYLKSPFWTVDTLFYMKVKKGYDLLFVYSISQTVRWKKYDESTGVPSLSKTTINNITKTFPPYKEQVAIGKFFDKINELIDLEQIKLDKLKNLKKAYLRKMFI